MLLAAASKSGEIRFGSLRFERKADVSAAVDLIRVDY
jgi:hypothetical protein